MTRPVAPKRFEGVAEYIAENRRRPVRIEVLHDDHCRAIQVGEAADKIGNDWHIASRFLGKGAAGRRGGKADYRGQVGKSGFDAPIHKAAIARAKFE